MPSYFLPHTQIGNKTKKLLFQLFNPHLEGTLINLHMNEKKFFGSRKGGPLKKPTEQVTWDLIHTIFLELFTADLLKNKIKTLSFVCADIFTE